MAGNLFRGIGLLALLLPGLALADDAETRLIPAGVWKGTLGGQKIMLCVNPPPDYMPDTYYGNYYYLRHLRPIHLSHENDATGWVEQGEKGRQYKLTLDMPDTDTLEGAWTSPAQELTLPIRLQRVEIGDDDSAPCGSDAYNMPLETQLERRVGKVETFQGHRYRTQTLTLKSGEGGSMNISVISLLEKGRSVDAVNLDLQKHMPHTRAELDDNLLYCRRATLSQYAGEGELVEDMRPVFWSRRWLSLELGHGYNCAGAHPSAETLYATWNLQTGKELNPWSWISGAAMGDTLGVAPKGLDKLVLAHAVGVKEDGDCTEAFAGEVNYYLHLGKKGLLFFATFPHSIQACDEDIEVPYGELMPFLNTAAKAEVQGIMRGE